MKRTIGLNEFELKRMIAESVRRVLKEGKRVNNKPMFKQWTANGRPYGAEETIGKGNFIHHDNADGTVRIPQPKSRPATQDEIDKHDERTLRRNLISYLANEKGLSREELSRKTTNDIETLYRILNS